jgi:hypothetical protein
MLHEEPTEPNTLQGGMPTLLPAPLPQGQPSVRETMLTLADQLLVLFDEIPCAGLIRSERHKLHQHVQTYFRLADGVWEALAEHQMEDLSSNPTFTSAVDALEQRLLLIHEAYERAPQDPKARGGWLWRRRIRLYSRALLEWKRCLDSGPDSSTEDARRCGRVLYRAHGRVGLAGTNGLSHLLVLLLPLLGVIASLGLAGVLGAINFTRQTPAGYFAPTALAALSALYILWFNFAGPAPLPLVLGYAFERREALYFAKAQRVPRVIASHLGPLRSLLRAFLMIAGALFLAGLLGILVVTVLFTFAFFSNPTSSTSQDFAGTMTTAFSSALGGYLPQQDPLLLTLALPLCSLLAMALLFLPFTLTVQIRMSRELLGHPGHGPELRRSHLLPALQLLLFHTITLFLLALLATSIFHTGDTALWPNVLPILTVRALLYVGALILPYVLLIDLPFRQGIARWRAARLSELRRNRAAVRQGANQTLPQVGNQAELLALQEQVSWLFFREQEAEVKEVPSTPFSPEGRLLALALSIVTGLLLNELNGFLVGFLNVHF